VRVRGQVTRCREGKQSDRSRIAETINHCNRNPYCRSPSMQPYPIQVDQVSIHRSPRRRIGHLTSTVSCINLDEFSLGIPRLYFKTEYAGGSNIRQGTHLSLGVCIVDTSIWSSPDNNHHGICYQIQPGT